MKAAFAYTPALLAAINAAAIELFCVKFTADMNTALEVLAAKKAALAVSKAAVMFALAVLTYVCSKLILALALVT